MQAASFLKRDQTEVAETLRFEREQARASRSLTPLNLTSPRTEQHGLLETLDRQTHAFHLAQVLDGTLARGRIEDQIREGVIAALLAQSLHRVEIQNQHTRGDGHAKRDAQDRQQCTTGTRLEAAPG